MSKTDVQRLLGKMLVDKEFKAALREKPEQMIAELGIHLSDEEKRFVAFIYEREDANRKRRRNALEGVKSEVDALLRKIVQHKAEITVETICQIHEAIFTPDTLGEPGKFREKPVYLRDVDVANCQVKIEPISNRLPSSEDVPGLLHSFCQWLNAELGTVQEDAILLAATAKHKFVCIHPFADGNGRVGRALVNLTLAWFDSPESFPAQFTPLPSGQASTLRFDLLEEKRDAYYKALKQADEGDLQMLRDFIEAGMFVKRDA
ncbi:Fic family protein [Candidatus Poribacteria bacterium]|nr:Fic family protein [Candidatus Poribacteria bacterium]